MANETIPDLPAVVTLSPNAQFWAVQSGTDVRVSVAQIVALATGISLLNLQAEQLTVTAPNTVSNLSMAPAMGFSMLVVNGLVFLPVGGSPAFSIAGQTVTWLSMAYSLQTTDSVFAVYLVG